MLSGARALLTPAELEGEPMGKRSNFERRPGDFYATPREAVMPLLPHLKGVRRFSEPCAGAGDLVRHLEAHGLKCAYAGDISAGRDAFACESFDAPVITNPPWTRDVLHPLIAHFMRAAPFAWLLFDSDWSHTKQSTVLIQHCSLILPIGRVKWIPGTRDVGKDNAAWYRFQAEHTGGPFISRTAAIVRGAATVRAAASNAVSRTARSAQIPDSVLTPVASAPTERG